MTVLPAATIPWPPNPNGHDIVVVDVEGNGQQPPEIVEIAVLPITSGNPITSADLRTWLVRPIRPISGLVTRKVHGITNAEVADAPRWDEIASEVAALLDGRILVAHNASVERRVLGSHLPQWQPPLVLDTMRLAKTVWPNLPGGYGLDNLIHHAALTPPEVPTDTSTSGSTAGGRHRAGFDTWMTAALLHTLLAQDGLDWDQLLNTARLPSPARPVGTAPGNNTGANNAVSNTDTQEGLW